MTTVASTSDFALMGALTRVLELLRSTPFRVMNRVTPGEDWRS
jgi:hypothetical protein